MRISGQSQVFSKIRTETKPLDQAEKKRLPDSEKDESTPSARSNQQHFDKK